MQKDIVMIYRPTNECGWSDRCLLYGEGYNDKKMYNHRNILNNEIVLEYDLDPELNNQFANKVYDRLKKFNIKCGKYKSGNKSVHNHCYLAIPETITDINTLKRVFMRFFGVFYYDKVDKKYYFDKNEVPKEYWQHIVDKEGRLVTIFSDKVELFERMQKVFPDMQLAANHPIRCEFGVHEKTGNRKTPMRIDEGYMEPQIIPQVVLEKYGKEKEKMMKASMTRHINKLDEEPIVKDLLNTVKFKEEVGDKRERLLFAFIHIFKHKYEKEELKDLLSNWYIYSGGNKLGRTQISSKVDYHYNKDYKVGISYIKRILEE